VACFPREAGLPFVTHFPFSENHPLGKSVRDPERSDGQVVKRAAAVQDVTSQNVINTVLIVFLLLEATAGALVVGYFWIHSMWLWLAT
jgi:hypothetical protein